MASEDPIEVLFNPEERFHLGNLMFEASLESGIDCVAIIVSIPDRLMQGFEAAYYRRVQEKWNQLPRDIRMGLRMRFEIK